MAASHKEPDVTVGKRRWGSLELVPWPRHCGSSGIVNAGEEPGTAVAESQVQLASPRAELPVSGPIPYFASLIPGGLCHLACCVTSGVVVRFCQEKLTGYRKGNLRGSGAAVPEQTFFA